MTSPSVSSGSNRNLLSLALIVLGALLLLVVPVYLVYQAFSRTEFAELPGTLVILSVVSGMALVVLGSAIRE